MQKTPYWNMPTGLWLCRRWENTFGQGKRLETFSVTHVQSSVESIDAESAQCNYSFNTYTWFSFSCKTKTILPKEEGGEGEKSKGGGGEDSEKKN